MDAALLVRDAFHFHTCLIRGGDSDAVRHRASDKSCQLVASTIDLLLRVDTAGATHRLFDWAREGQIRFSVGYDLTDAVRTAVLSLPEQAWLPTLDQDGTVRSNGEVAELTASLDLTSWPAGSRVLVRRERPHPGAQLSFTDHNGYRFQAILTTRLASRSQSLSAATAHAPELRITSAATKTPAFRTCRSATLSTTACGCAS